MSQGSVTTDHRKIRQWADERGGAPATVKATEKPGEPGILRIMLYPKDAALQAVSWDDFFAKFEREGLAFLYQDRTEDGAVSRFHKFINRS